MHRTIGIGIGRLVSTGFLLAAAIGATGAGSSTAQAATVRTPTQAPRTVSVSPGAFHVIPNCTTSDCRYVQVATRHIALSYTVRMYEQWRPQCQGYGSNFGTRQWYSYTAHSNPSNYVVYGHTGCVVWAIVRGHASNHLVWP